jgi:hypothetical protein
MCGRQVTAVDKLTEGDITHRTTPDVSPEQARGARARVWSFIFQCWQENQKADKPVPEPVGRDGTKVKGDSANAILPH